MDDYDFDGKNNLFEFITGSSPTNENDATDLSVSMLPNGKIEVSISTRATDPTMHYGLKRYYTLQQQPNLTDTNWTRVPHVNRVLGSGQIIRSEETPSEATVFTRLQIELN